MVLQTIPSVGVGVERLATQFSRIELAIATFEERLRSHESAIQAIVLSSQQDNSATFQLATYTIAFVNFMIELESFEVPALQVLRDCAAGSPNWIIFAAALWYNMREFISEYYNIDLTIPDAAGEITVDSVNFARNNKSVNADDIIEEPYMTVPIARTTDSGSDIQVAIGNAPILKIDREVDDTKRQARRKQLMSIASVLQCG